LSPEEFARMTEKVYIVYDEAEARKWPRQNGGRRIKNC